MIESKRAFGRLLLGAALLAPPLLCVLPGCGGGSGGSSNRYFDARGVELFDSAQPGTPVLARGNLRVNFKSSSPGTQSATGYLLVLEPGNTTNTATATPATTATTTATPTATATTTTPLVGRQSKALPGNYLPGGATYQFTGTVSLASSSSPLQLNLRGAFSPSRPFTITGTLQTDANLTLTQTVVSDSGTTSTGTLSMRVLDHLINLATPTPTASPTATATPTGTPVATATATPTVFATATPTPTVFATATPTPTATPTVFATATPTPTALATATPTSTLAPF